MAKDGFIVFMRNSSYNKLDEDTLISMGIYAYDISMFDPSWLMPRTIFTFDNYGQLLAEGVDRVISQ